MSQNNIQKDDIDNVDYFCKAGATPKTISISHSNTCNLWCESCRNELYVEKGEDAERAIHISEIVVKEMLPKAESIIIAGNGEVFASAAYKYILDFASEYKMTEKNLNKVLGVGGVKSIWSYLWMQRQKKRMKCCAAVGIGSC